MLSYDYVNNLPTIRRRLLITFITPYCFATAILYAGYCAVEDVLETLKELWDGNEIY